MKLKAFIAENVCGNTKTEPSANEHAALESCAKNLRRLCTLLNLNTQPSVMADQTSESEEALTNLNAIQNAK